MRGKGRREDRVAVTAGVGSEGAGYAPPHVMRRSREPRFGRTRPRMRKLKLAVVRKDVCLVLSNFVAWPAQKIASLESCSA